MSLDLASNRSGDSSRSDSSRSSSVRHPPTITTRSTAIKRRCKTIVSVGLCVNSSAPLPSNSTPIRLKAVKDRAALAAFEQRWRGFYGEGGIKKEAVRIYLERRGGQSSSNLHPLQSTPNRLKSANNPPVSAKEKQRGAAFTINPAGPAHNPLQSTL